MMVLLDALTGWGVDWAQAGFVVFLRIGAVMALLPGFGEASVPQRVRLGLALAFTAIVAPVVAVPPMALPGYGAEVIAGLALGMGLRIFVLALQTAGAIAAQAASLSQLIGGAGEPQPAIGHLLTIGGLALAMATDLHLRAAEMLILSYDVLPAGRLPEASDMADWGLAQVRRAFSLGFSLAAPFVLASLIYNVALGVINRAMPQLMVSFIGAPALTLGGLILLAVTVPLALGVWLAAFNGWMADPFMVPP